MKDDDKYRLRWGLHRGTMMSRDASNGELFDTEEECRKRWDEIEIHVKGFLMSKIWFAHMITPTEETIKLHVGEPYI